MPTPCTSLPVPISRELSDHYGKLAHATRATHGEPSAGGWVLMCLSNIMSPAYGSVERAMAFADLRMFAQTAIGMGCEPVPRPQWFYSYRTSRFCFFRVDLPLSSRRACAAQLIGAGC